MSDTEYDNTESGFDDAEDAQSEDQTKPKAKRGGYRPDGGRQRGDIRTRKPKTKSLAPKERAGEALATVGVTLDVTEFGHFGSLDVMQYLLALHERFEIG